MGLEPTTACLQSTPGRPWQCVRGSRGASHKESGARCRTAGFVAVRVSLAPRLAPPAGGEPGGRGTSLGTINADRIISLGAAQVGGRRAAEQPLGVPRLALVDLDRTGHVAHLWPASRRFSVLSGTRTRRSDQRSPALGSS
jgi:hypothetical protein